MMASESRRARAAIFSRLRAAQTSEPLAAPDVSPHFCRQVPGSETESESESESRTERFMRNARSWRAEVIETSLEQWPRRLAEVIHDRQAMHVLAGFGTAIAPSLAACLPESRLSWYQRKLPAFKAELFGQIDAGITTTLGGVAQTGSLLLRPSPAEPRTLSLVPPLHVAILYESRLYETLWDAMSGQRWAADMPSNLLMVTGPSKTADIQRTLVYGAHGPKALVILLIRDSPAAASAGAQT